MVLLAANITMCAGFAHAQKEDEPLVDKIKKLFSRPTPSVTPRKHRKKSSPSPSASPAESRSSPDQTPSTSPEPSASPETTTTPIPKSQPHYFEPVRAISPGPRTRPQIPRRVVPSPETKSTESPAAEADAIVTPGETPESRPIPSLPPAITASPSPAKSPSVSVTTKPTGTPLAKKIEEPRQVFPTDQIAESPSYPPRVRKIVDYGLYLTARHLPYKYASADPAKGGMDCSGFIHYVLMQSGIADAPRDAREQYAWVRKAGNFKSVLAQRDDTFELDELQPGDLLFWASNFGISRDAEIIQTMIYIGRDKTTNARLMMGAAEHGTFKGQAKSGVSVFDFKLGSSPKTDKETAAVFVGFGRIPDLPVK